MEEFKYLIPEESIDAIISNNTVCGITIITFIIVVIMLSTTPPKYPAVIG